MTIKTSNIVSAKVAEAGYFIGKQVEQELEPLINAIQHLAPAMLAGILESNPSICRLLENIEPLLAYYFNEDNPSVVEYSLTPPRGDNVSIGTFYLAYNHTNSPITVGEVSDCEISIKPHEFLVLNLGLIGFTYSLRENQATQITVHSALDGIDYFSGGYPLSQSLLVAPKNDDGIFSGSLCVDDFITHGIAVNSLRSEIADQLLGLVKKEHFVAVKQNQLDACCDYSDRFISKHSMFRPQKIKDQYHQLVDAVNHLSSGVLLNKTNPSGDNLTVFMASAGHFMDLHADCADGSPIITIVYLSDDKFIEDDGGQVSVSSMVMNEQTGLFEFSGINVKAPPSHGLVVHLNNSTPKFHHRVHKLLASKWRYSIIINPSMLTNPSWDVAFEEEQGKVDYQEITLDDPSALND